MPSRKLGDQNTQALYPVHSCEWGRVRQSETLPTPGSFDLFNLDSPEALKRSLLSSLCTIICTCSWFDLWMDSAAFQSDAGGLAVGFRMLQVWGFQLRAPFCRRWWGWSEWCCFASSQGLISWEWKCYQIKYKNQNNLILGIPFRPPVSKSCRSVTV